MILVFNQYQSMSTPELLLFGPSRAMSKIMKIGIPPNSTWNLKISPWERAFVLKTHHSQLPMLDNMGVYHHCIGQTIAPKSPR